MTTPTTKVLVRWYCPRCESTRAADDYYTETYRPACATCMEEYDDDMLMEPQYEEQDAEDVSVSAPTYATTTHTVWAQNLGCLQERIEKLSRRAVKLGLPALTLCVLSTVDETAEDGVTINRRYEVEVTGAAPRINGWTFVATLDHTSEGTIVRTVPELSEEGAYVAYREARPLCQHCGLLRQRLSTYLLRAEDGVTLKQVGSSCLMDFLGHANPHALAEMAEMWIEVDAAAAEASEWGMGGGRAMLSTSAYLQKVAAVMRAEGWLSRSKAREYGKIATADATLNALDHEHRCRNSAACRTPHYPVTDADVTLAQDALSWAQALGEDGATLDDYLFNLHVACRLGALEYKQLGLAASAISAYQRAMGRIAERKLKAERGAKSEWVGEVGKRETFTLTVESLRWFDSNFGTKTLYRMWTPEGNLCIWWSTGGLDLEEGQTYTLLATVKEHSEYNGVKQTVLTRCAFPKGKRGQSAHIITAESGAARDSVEPLQDGERWVADMNTDGGAWRREPSR